jgi:hypothetical protein
VSVNHGVAKATFTLERQLKADVAREGTITIPNKDSFSLVLIL